MGDMIDYFRAMKDHAKDERADAWEHRHDLAKQIADETGFILVVVDDNSRHCRINLGGGRHWIDVWPSTQRWVEKLPNGNHGRRGFGVDSLLGALKALKMVRG